MDAALAALRDLAVEAARDADLVVLPEMAVTGYLFDGPEHVAPVAEAAGGPLFEVFSEVAREAGTWLVVGFPERDGERFYNSAYVIDREGRLAFTYRKTLLYPADETWAAPGDTGWKAFDTGAGRFTVGICMDLNDDDFIAWCRDEQVRAIAFPTNWLEEGYDVWRYWAWRMGDVCTALIGANTYGAEGDVAFSGRSAVIDQLKRGEFVIRASLPETGDGVLRDVLPARV